MADKVIRTVVRLDIAEAVRKAEKLGSSLEKALGRGLQSGANTTITKFRGEIRKLEQSVNRLQTAQGKLTGANSRYTESVRRTSTEVRKQIDINRKNNVEITRGNRSFLNTAAAVTKSFIAYQILSGILRTLSQELLDVARAGIEYQASTVGIIRTTGEMVGGLEDGRIVLTALGKELTGTLLDLTRQIPATIAELNKIGAIGGQLGIEATDLDEFVETIARLSQVTELEDVEEAATAIARFAQILRLEGEEIERFGSALVQLGNDFAVTEPEILALSARLAGVGSVVNLTAEEIAGISAAVGSLGIGLQASGTAVQKVLNTINTAVQTSNDKLPIFAAVAGQSAEEFARSFNEDAAGAFTAFVEGLGRQGNQAIITLSELGLADQRLIRTILALASSGDLLADSIATSTEAYAENNALAEESALRAATTADKVQILRNAWEELKLSLAETEFIGDIVEGLGEAVQGLSDAAQARRGFRELKSDLDEIGISAKAVSDGFSLFANDASVANRLNIFDDNDTFLAQGETALKTLDELEVALFTLTQQPDITPGGLNEIISQFREAGVSAREFIEAAENLQQVEQVAEALGVTESQAQILVSGLRNGELAMSDFSLATLQALSTTEAFGAAASNALIPLLLNTDALKEASSADRLLSQSREDMTTAINEANLAFLESQGVSRELALELLGLVDVDGQVVQSTEEIIAQQDFLIAVEKARIDVVKEAISELGTFTETNGMLAETMLESAEAAGASAEQLLELAVATGVVSEADAEFIALQADMQLYIAEQIQLVQNGEQTYGEAAVAIQEYADGIGLTAEIAARAAPEIQALSEVVAEAADEYLDASDATEAFVSEQLKLAVQSGASADTLLRMVNSLSVFSDEEKEAIAATVELAQVQGLLSSALGRSATGLSFAVTALQRFQNATANVKAEVAGFGGTDSTFGSFFDSVAGSAGRAGGAVEESRSSFRQFYSDLIRNDEALEDIGERTEGFGQSLLNLAIDAGASVEQIGLLAVATGQLSEEQAAQIFQLAAAEAGLEKLAELYVSGQLTAEEAAGAVGALTEQIASGQAVDLTSFGIDIGAITSAGNAANQYASSAGGAAQATQTWQEQLFQMAESSGASFQSLLLLAEQAGKTGSEIREALIGQFEEATLQNLGDRIAEGLDPEKASEFFTRIQEGITQLETDDLALLLDIAVDEDLQVEEIIKTIERIIQKQADDNGPVDVTTGVNVRAVTAVDVAVASGDAVATSIGGEDVVFEIDGDPAKLIEAVREKTQDQTYTTDVDGDTEELESDIEEAVSGRDYEASITADEETLVASIQDALNDTDFSLDFDIDTPSTAPSSSVASSSTSSSDPQVFEQGGLVVGSTHAQGGTIIEAEDGEFVVSKDNVNPDTIGVLDAINQGNYTAVPRAGVDVNVSTSPTPMQIDPVDMSFDSLASIAMPSEVLDSLDAITRMAPADMAGIESGLASLSSILGTMMTSAPVPSVNNSTSVDMSSKNTSHVYNNYYYGQVGSPNAVVPGATRR